eukprot:1626953-Prymnesium_polylepis.1
MVSHAKGGVGLEVSARAPRRRVLSAQQPVVAELDAPAVVNTPQADGENVAGGHAEVTAGACAVGVVAVEAVARRDQSGVGGRAERHRISLSWRRKESPARGCRIWLACKDFFSY